MEIKTSLLIFRRVDGSLEVAPEPIERLLADRPISEVAVLAAIDTNGHTWYQRVRDHRQFADYDSLARDVARLLATR